MTNKILQKQLAFYILYQAFKRDREEYVPTWKFVGEIYINEFEEWYMASYKCPTRLTDIYQDNPGLLDRHLITGKSGARYYEYRFSDEVNIELILDASLRDFYKKIRKSG